MNILKRRKSRRMINMNNITINYFSSLLFYALFCFELIILWNGSREVTCFVPSPIITTTTLKGYTSKHTSWLSLKSNKVEVQNRQKETVAEINDEEPPEPFTTTTTATATMTKTALETNFSSPGTSTMGREMNEQVQVEEEDQQSLASYIFRKTKEMQQSFIGSSGDVLVQETDVRTGKTREIKKKEFSSEKSQTMDDTSEITDSTSISETNINNNAAVIMMNEEDMKQLDESVNTLMNFDSLSKDMELFDTSSSSTSSAEKNTSPNNNIMAIPSRAVSTTSTVASEKDTSTTKESDSAKRKKSLKASFWKRLFRLQKQKESSMNSQQQQVTRQKSPIDQSSTTTAAKTTSTAVVPNQSRYLQHSHGKISRDIRYMAVRIASTITSTDLWTIFVKENGGFIPLFETIRETNTFTRTKFPSSDSTTHQRQQYSYSQQPRYQYPQLSLTEIRRANEQKEEDLSMATSAFKSLRDLCALSPDLAAVVTDSILQEHEFGRNSNMSNIRDSNRRNNDDGVVGTKLLNDIVALLKYLNDYIDKNESSTATTAAALSSKTRNNNNSVTVASAAPSGTFGRLLRRKTLATERRKRCRLHVIQLLLAMVIASDKAIDVFRETPGLIDSILACSSYANMKRERLPLRQRIRTFISSVLLRRRRVDLPTTIKMKPRKLNSTPHPFPSSKNKDKSAITDEDQDISQGIEEIEQASNKLLAALGYNIWVPKTPGQKGLRILCLDGGGTRGMTAIAALRAITDSLGGIEPYDAFDIICGTSTGGIIAFLMGLRRESTEKTKFRYDTLIKRIFVKSALSTPMLVFTTASYDEGHFSEVMSEILKDQSMLDSRANPDVPLVFAISSKMSSTPTQLSIFRNYNYSSGDMPDKVSSNNVSLQMDE